MTIPRIILAMVAALALSSCSMLAGKHEELAIYAPALTHTAAKPATTSGSWQLAVFEPRAIGPLDSNRIAVMPAAGQIETYKGVRWRDRAPIMIQQLMLQLFQELPGPAGAGLASGMLRADFSLHTDLQDFQADYRGAQTPTVVVRLAAQLVDNSTNRVVASRVFSAEESTSSGNVSAVFSAFQSALNELLPNLIDWARSETSAAWKDGSH